MCDETDLDLAEVLLSLPLAAGPAEVGGGGSDLLLLLLPAAVVDGGCCCLCCGGCWLLLFANFLGSSLRRNRCCCCCCCCRCCRCCGLPPGRVVAFCSSRSPLKRSGNNVCYYNTHNVCSFRCRCSALALIRWEHKNGCHLAHT